MTNGAPDNWGEYRRLILSELERISRDIESVRVKVDRSYTETSIEVARLKEQAASHARVHGFWAGVIASLIVGLVMQLAVRALSQ